MPFHRLLSFLQLMEIQDSEHSRWYKAQYHHLNKLYWYLYPHETFPSIRFSTQIEANLHGHISPYFDFDGILNILPRYERSTRRYPHRHPHQQSQEYQLNSHKGLRRCPNYQNKEFLQQLARIVRLFHRRYYDIPLNHQSHRQIDPFVDHRHSRWQKDDILNPEETIVPHYGHSRKNALQLQFCARILSTDYYFYRKQANLNPHQSHNQYLKVGGNLNHQPKA